MKNSNVGSGVCSGVHMWGRNIQWQYTHIIKFTYIHLLCCFPTFRYFLFCTTIMIKTFQKILLCEDLIVANIQMTATKEQDWLLTWPAILSRSLVPWGVSLRPLGGEEQWDSIQDRDDKVRATSTQVTTRTHWGPSQSSWAARGPEAPYGPRSWTRHWSGLGTRRSSCDLHRSWSWSQHRHLHGGRGGALLKLRWKGDG